MTEPQVWVLIGVFATALFGMITLMSTMFVRIIRTEIGSVGTEIGSVRTEIGSVRAEIQGIHHRLDRLDADVNALMKHAFGIDRG